MQDKEKEDDIYYKYHPQNFKINIKKISAQIQLYLFYLFITFLYSFNLFITFLYLFNFSY